MRTPLSRVRGLGSARSGTRDFWLQRLTSIASVPLTIYFVFVVATLAGRSHATVSATLGDPVVAILLLNFLVLWGYPTLTETLLRAVEEHDAASTTPPRLSGLLTESEAASCWRGLAETHSFDRYAAAPAQVLLPDGQREGDQVVALLGLDDDGSAQSWVMPQECTSNPDTLPVLPGQRHG